VLLDEVNPKAFTLVDLSPQMLAFTRTRFRDQPHLRFVNADALHFLATSEERVDSAVCLWSFSHAVHQTLHRHGIADGTSLVRKALANLVERVLTPGGEFFLIHFDSRSEEQSILMRQRSRLYPNFYDLSTQSPSKLALDSVLEELRDGGKIKMSSRHLQGDAIRYPSLEHALEVTFNFHLESSFNGSPMLPDALAEVEEYLSQFALADGSLALRPGCFVYEIQSLAVI
jgi:SAM-dependent methyltransferase